MTGQPHIFTFGIAAAPVSTTLAALTRPPNRRTVPGLVHAEILMPMALGSSVFSPKRIQLNRLTMFAAWDSEQAIDDFLASAKLGKVLAAGWHMRMRFLRRWGSVREFADLPESMGESDPAAPVAAYTLARMRLPELARFIHWGRPVEALVRDHPETTLALAAIRYPRSIATFSVWKSQQAMTDMVRGHSQIDQPKRHIDAMKERNRRDFHHEFTTLRFQPVSEHGSWNGVSEYIPNGPNTP